MFSAGLLAFLAFRLQCYSITLAGVLISHLGCICRVYQIWGSHLTSPALFATLRPGKKHTRRVLRTPHIIASTTSTERISSNPKHQLREEQEELEEEEEEEEEAQREKQRAVSWQRPFLRTPSAADLVALEVRCHRRKEPALS
jgi:hypothetical protein